MAVVLEPLPDSFVATREGLHRVAERLVAPARKPHNEIALHPTPGGFGTPEFEFEGQRLQVRVQGVELVLTRDGEGARTRLRSLAAGAALLGPGLLPDGMPDDEAPLALDPEAARVLADFYAFASQVLERLRDGMGAEDEPTATVLWPEHLDVAFEAGSEAQGERGTYGASPGDADHDEPYLYVGPWAPGVSGDLWNATGFKGAELGYAELRAADDPEAAAHEFMRSRYVALTGER
jgi:hypothetical protein